MAKTFEDYNWAQLVLTGGLNTLYVFELDKYLQKYNLPWKKKLKSEKIATITTHVREIKGDALCDVVVTGKEESNESEEEICQETLSDSDSSGSESDSESKDSGYNWPLITTNTRSGRRATSYLL